MDQFQKQKNEDVRAIMRDFSRAHLTFFRQVRKRHDKGRAEKDKGRAGQGTGQRKTRAGQGTGQDKGQGRERQGTGQDKGQGKTRAGRERGPADTDMPESCVKYPPTAAARVGAAGAGPRDHEGVSAHVPRCCRPLCGCPLPCPTVYRPVVLFKDLAWKPEGRRANGTHNSGRGLSLQVTCHLRH